MYWIVDNYYFLFVLPARFCFSFCFIFFFCKTAPSAPPVINKTKTKAEDGHTIRVTWNAIAKKDRNGVILRYKVTYNVDSQPTQLCLNTTYTNVVIKGLKLYTRYRIRVRGYTKIGPSPWAPYITVTTFQLGAVYFAKFDQFEGTNHREESKYSETKTNKLKSYRCLWQGSFLVKFEGNIEPLYLDKGILSIYGFVRVCNSFFFSFLPIYFFNFMFASFEYVLSLAVFFFFNQVNCKYPKTFGRISENVRTKIFSDIFSTQISVTTMFSWCNCITNNYLGDAKQSVFLRIQVRANSQAKGLEWDWKRRARLGRTLKILAVRFALYQEPIKWSLHLH